MLHLLIFQSVLIYVGQQPTVLINTYQIILLVILAGGVEFFPSNLWLVHLLARCLILNRFMFDEHVSLDRQPIKSQLPRFPVYSAAEFWSVTVVKL